MRADPPLPPSHAHLQIFAVISALTLLGLWSTKQYIERRYRE